MLFSVLVATAMAEEPFKPDYASNLFEVEFVTPPKVTLDLRFGPQGHYSTGDYASMICADEGSAWHCRMPEGIRSDIFQELVIVPSERMIVAINVTPDGTRTAHPVVRPMYPGDVPMADSEMPGMFAVDFRSFLSCTGPGCGPPPEPQTSPPPERRKRR